jgi:hypothetical protein
MGTSKKYCFTVQWGEKTNTDDCEGEIVACSEKRPSRNEVEALLPTFTGEIFQVPPVFSAIKIDGQRAYKRARAGAPSQSSVFVFSPHCTVKKYCFEVPMTYETVRVARPKATARTPVARGSNVPACPALHCLPNRLRTSETTRAELTPYCLSTTSQPVISRHKDETSVLSYKHETSRYVTS